MQQLTLSCRMTYVLYTLITYTMKRFLFLILLLGIGSHSFAQSDSPLIPEDMVAYYHHMGKAFTVAPQVLSQSPLSMDKRSEVKVAVKDANLFSFDQQAAKTLGTTAPDFLKLDLPLKNGQELELELVRVNIFADGFFVNTDLQPEGVDVPLGVHYRGIIKGQPGSIAALSVFDNELMGIFSSPSAGNLVLGRLEGINPRHDHILYNDADLTRLSGFECGTPDDGQGYTAEELAPRPNTRALDCIKVYLEVDSDIRANKGGVGGATSYVTGAFNQVAAIYAGEGLNYQLSQVFVWASAGPYTSGSSSSLLNQFKSRISSLNGNFGHLLSYRSSGGIAAGFSGLCNSNVDNSLCFSDIYASYSTVPTYSWTVYVMTHEMGHLNGSRHTHACVWNGNSTAIDGCAGYTEGSCPVPGYPSGGGTIMSYCHIRSTGINFSKGFGPQPQAVIRNAAIGASCTCNGGAGGGSGIPYGSTISLQANANKKFVVAENGGNSYLIANRTAVGGWEQFEVVNAGGGYVALKALVNNKYVVAENGGTTWLYSNRTAIGPWEKFSWINNSDGTVSFRAMVNNMYVTAESAGADPLIANRTAIGSWEKFYVNSITSAAPNSLEDFKAWPNPAEHYLNLQGVEAGSTVEILDIQGRVLMRGQETRQVVIHYLLPGMYFLRINGETKHKFVKQ